MSNILKVQEAKYYQEKFKSGLVLCGVEEGQPLWLGNWDKTE